METSKRQLEEYAMKFLSEDDTFSFETLRTTGSLTISGPTAARRWRPPENYTQYKSVWIDPS
jgi:hypothetical protein